MLEDKDRIFQNLYNDMGSDVFSSQKRGDWVNTKELTDKGSCLLYTSPSPRDGLLSRMPSSA